jgi:hypothetical protein
MIPFSATLPDITGSDATRMYRLGDYTALLVERPRVLAEKQGVAPGLVEYVFALAILTTSKPHDLVLIVTAEKTGRRLRQAAAESGRAHTDNAFLCIFNESGGHENLGHSPDWTHPDKFVIRALAEAAKRLNITATPVQIQLKASPRQTSAAGASNRARVILVAWFVAVTLAAVIVPWKIDYRSGNIATQLYRGYSPIWDPPVTAATIDYGRVFLEILAITGVAGVLYVLLGRK